MIKGIIPERDYKSKKCIPINLQLFASSGDTGTEEGKEDTNNGPEGGDEGNKGLETGIELPKTKEELLKLLGTETEKKVLEAVEKAKIKWNEEFKNQLEKEKLEAEKLSKMTKEEKEKHIFEKQKLELANKEKELLQKEMKLAKIDIFSERKLPIKFVDFVTGDSAEEIKQNIDSFEKEWKEAIEEAVNEKLKGRSPFSGTSKSSGTSIAKQLLEINKNSNNENLQKAKENYFK